MACCCSAVKVGAAVMAVDNIGITGGNKTSHGLDKLEQLYIKLFRANGHLWVLERILDAVISICLVNLLHCVVDRWLLRVGHQEEFCAYEDEKKWTRKDQEHATS